MMSSKQTSNWTSVDLPLPGGAFSPTTKAWRRDSGGNSERMSGMREPTTECRSEQSDKPNTKAAVAPPFGVTRRPLAVADAAIGAMGRSRRWSVEKQRLLAVDYNTHRPRQCVGTAKQCIEKQAQSDAGRIRTLLEHSRYTAS